MRCCGYEQGAHGKNVDLKSVIITITITIIIIIIIAAIIITI